MSCPVCTHRSHDPIEHHPHDLDAYGGDWLSVEHTSRYLGIGTNATYAAINACQITPVVRLGARGQIRVPKSTLRRMMGLPNESDDIQEHAYRQTHDVEDAVAAPIPMKGAG